VEKGKELHITVCQLSGAIYFWTLMKGDRKVAGSDMIDCKEKVLKDATEIAEEFGLEIKINERTKND
jgi:hypothetical protein